MQWTLLSMWIFLLLLQNCHCGANWHHYTNIATWMHNVSLDCYISKVTISMRSRVPEQIWCPDNCQIFARHASLLIKWCHTWQVSHQKRTGATQQRHQSDQNSISATSTRPLHDTDHPDTSYSFSSSVLRTSCQHNPTAAAHHEITSSLDTLLDTRQQKMMR